MNFKSLNESFEDKYIISKNLLVEEEKLLEEKKNSKKRLVESIDRPLNERDWKLTVPGNYRDAIFNAGEEEDFDGVRSALIDICNYVIENIDEADFDLDDQNYIVEEFEEFAEELDQVDFDGEDEANYYLNELYDLLDNTDIFLGLREAITEDVEEGMANASAVYTDVWVSMGEADSLWKERIKLLTPYRVTKELMKKANPDAIFLHCLPSFHDTNTTIGKEIHEKFGVNEMEVTDEVFESKQSVVFDEAENRMHTIKAVMYATL